MTSQKEFSELVGLVVIPVPSERGSYATVSLRLYAKIMAANSNKLNFINQRNEPHHKKEHVKISQGSEL